ncbi:MAG: bifunctional metallophosphatase/5'-nucleotidase [Bacteroidales bacterium]|nr:bifunctional metallophosphatase/5'-nucleotidase [Bacteroidales bacterium]
MKKAFYILFAAVCLFILSCSGQKYTDITILETTDLHGMLWPYDYTEKRSVDASLAAVHGYVRKVRAEHENVVLLDNGDNIQGQPSVYYYNFIDTLTPHMISRAFNYMNYDAASVGNHDIEAGHSVYDRLVSEYKFPLLAANAVHTSSGEPYFKPYAIITRKGVRIAVLGLITPAVPTWLPDELYSGISFMDMTETARKWMPVIQREKPDLIIGLFHSGWDRSRNISEEGINDENGSVSVAYNVPGFDIIFNGHDHRTANEFFVNSADDSVLILNGGSRAQSIARADVRIASGKTKGKKIMRISGEVVTVAGLAPDEEYIEKFRSDDEVIKAYVDRKIGKSVATVTSRDSYFGPSAFVDLIHSIQIDITGADVSFAAPLSFDVKIDEGDVTVGDMFKLYRFENMLYTMLLSGEEIRSYLEFSYAGWFNTMKSADDNLLRFREKDGAVMLTDGKAWLRNQPYNFDSASGIEYTVDVSKPEGARVKISGFTDGRAFDPKMSYKVAVNSYRGNGGGGHFTEGAGISGPDLRKRLLKSTDRDLRYYIMKSIEQSKIIDPRPGANWKVIPEDWVLKARSRDYALLFGK